MRVGEKSPSRAVIEFDHGGQHPVEIYEAFERMLAAWPDARVPLKLRRAKGVLCGCGSDHDGWVCSHCTAPERAA